MPIALNVVEQKDLKNKQRYSEGYRLVGNHSAVKICEYCKKAITGKDVCYKNTFYGIESWRCVQMSPTFFCDHRCVFCWRDIEYVWPKWQGPVDDPKDIVEGCIKAHIELLQGFKGNSEAIAEKVKEMGKPLHFAISLTGEPTMYPKLPEMIDFIKEKGMTAFLVTNGTIPFMVEKLIAHQPTQLYISVYGPNKEIYQKTANPISKDAWEKLHKSLSIMHKFKRNVVRLTLVKNYNFVDPEGYARLIEKYKPMFVECKGFSFIGHAQERLQVHNMPYNDEVLEFAKKIQQNSSYKLIDSKKESRVALLARDDFKDRKMNFEGL
ncbi:MAG: 4-demethylwyosine synthase TYW1 [Candidatus Woesearchaeota archaeon]|mgnify:FL=1|jgi:tRNA wybutosine-synthesizing protein 1|nr:4-demethylwyosine synthase TYW1 [Candidatus Woesearchaeota archaeon]MDP6265870.1 4-demethylwyosine synthase TYW1 [Candidatus Woesearchaeota archaeon]MDP7322536.1 4-demethylwyosine synthase TYW1 [Candidatus Woesearchaeota archaeon]MDP7476269.1 4-demethylwyosine synthase TYW1 [Candidatus Woesearchaeota archaeon]HJO02132.1 4-demethylwyosine synthase TYW1 [Candidatus Woesearchaeota archaeon]|tara:strand:- start:109 stop:1077 length:969 start_codon:yes stop_codon:yes gene_type:complete